MVCSCCWSIKNFRVEIKTLCHESFAELRALEIAATFAEYEHEA